MGVTLGDTQIYIAQQLLRLCLVDKGIQVCGMYASYRGRDPGSINGRPIVSNGNHTYLNLMNCQPRNGHLKTIIFCNKIY